MTKQKLLRECKISIPTPLGSLLAFAVVAPASRAWLRVGSRAVVCQCPACGLSGAGGDAFPVHLSATFSDTFQACKTALMCRGCFDGLPDVTKAISVKLAGEWLDAKAAFDARFRARYPNLRWARF